MVIAARSVAAVPAVTLQPYFQLSISPKAIAFTPLVSVAGRSLLVIVAPEFHVQPAAAFVNPAIKLGEANIPWYARIDSPEDERFRLGPPEILLIVPFDADTPEPVPLIMTSLPQSIAVADVQEKDISLIPVEPPQVPAVLFQPTSEKLMTVPADTDVSSTKLKLS